MANPELKAKKRSRDIKSVRESGDIPAVVYGPGMKESEAIVLEYQVFLRLFRKAGESTVIDLNVEGNQMPVLVHSLDLHPVTGEFEHVDFYALDMKQEVTTNISLVFVGTAPAVKEKSAILITSKSELEVKCLPKDLVHDIEVDISGLVEYHDHVSIKDIAIPEGITVLDDMEAVIISAAAPKIEEEEPVEAEEGEEGEGVEAEEGEETGDADESEKTDKEGGDKDSEKEN